MVKWIVPIMLVAAFACERRPQDEGAGTEGAVGAEREPGQMQQPGQEQQPGQQGQQQPGQQPQGQEQAATEQDRQVMQNVHQALQDADLSETAKNVQVMAKEGRVTLTGSVASAQEMAELERIVRGVPGVREIDNQVQVGGP